MARSAAPTRRPTRAAGSASIWMAMPVNFLRRFLSFCWGIFGGLEAPEVEVSAEVAEAFRRVAEALERHAGLLGGPISDRDRKLVLDSLGSVGSDYRAGLYAHGFADRKSTRLNSSHLGI